MRVARRTLLAGLTAAPPARCPSATVLNAMAPRDDVIPLAVSCIRTNFAAHGGDPGCLMGHSVGAQIVTLLRPNPILTPSA